jgi:tRNA U34 5-carboxymethylaminomethyl modifying GTPase MnmE/TrmE
MDLLKRREVLVNLISRVGRGQQNIYRWVDELMEIDAQIECQEQVQQKQETKKVTTDLKRVDTSLEKAKQQLLALGVLEESILIQDGLVVVLGADCREHEGKSFYWDKTVFPTEHDKGYKKDAGNVRINPAQIKNSQRKAWEDYKTKQGKKPVQPFEKWLSGRLVNLPELELVVSKIDAKPASIWIKEDLYYYELIINRTSRHVQELSAAIHHEMNGKDYQDDKFMVFLSNQETIVVATREQWKLTTHVTLMKKEGDTKKEFYVKDEVFSPIMEKLNLAAKKCGDSFEMPFGLRVM